MKSSELRQSFLSYFESKQHQVVESSSLIPGNDPTLLFTNAGMVQFKDVFLGTDKRNYTRATTSQRCVRAGGKHNDLENVGYTARHHTFFEMLGNFSFGDYFKQDAIGYAWEFLTKVAKLPQEKLLVTVYAEDDEAFDIWHKEIGLPKEKIIRIGDNKGARYASDNFWQMGDTGPCGPCTEVFYDHGEHIWGGPPGSPEEDGDRFIEIWNVVFMQFNRSANGDMAPLPKPSVDTGMGLERIAAILQGVHSNYEIDLFQNLIKASANAVGTNDLESQSLRVIADHIRSCSFMIVDGVVPSNEGRGYVLRRIIRRAIRHGNKLGQKGVFFHTLVEALDSEMGEAYPELRKLKERVASILLKEEEQFAKTLDQGMRILEEAISELGDSKVIPGETVFKLYDTYGFPADLTNDVARENELEIDEAGFEAAMEEQRARARSASNFSMDMSGDVSIDSETEFTGYTELEGDCVVEALIVDGSNVDEIQAGQDAVVLLKSTPFYGESGGQAGDQGWLRGPGAFKVSNTAKQGKAHLHQGVLKEGAIKVGDTVAAQVDRSMRNATALNHSATHLVHEALRRIVGDHVNQKGSLVNAERLRFDFSHFEGLTNAEIEQVEDMVNEQIRLNHEVITEIMDVDSAKEKGAMALFGEKYDSEVRVLTMGADYSIELCGGTHVKRTGDIGLFKIVTEGGIAAGVRRIEAVTGKAAIDAVRQTENALNGVAAVVKGNKENALEKVSALNDQARALQKEIDALKSKLAAAAGSDLAGQAIDIEGGKLLVAQVESDPKALRDLLDQLKSKLESAVILLAAVNDGKVSLIAGVTKELTKKVKAGDLIKMVAPLVDGKGGGRPDMAQAGGNNPAALPDALEQVPAWVKERI
ncbi:alanine--tRNA ligase [Marinomonas mediterranea]|jgi:alanyl-tRNA synthetase (EC 6.1.1.7)|uniref:Alanine--tRNA ligase n=1 Tax=Marinomonas mediterranea (strain ATCC 700492 / JCM 21426 / NBRC 103028 / MMB-1) TaxID=717774 RepID=F2K2I8_MARM1|nr:alanine--tRNA ligase [Marinomonas mediterranea]ADZ90033.1 alanyl-tRNA synthetase [Marinomonas mediterranea MMB-1]WCN08099.1 alanine--tRNA ligase [Marinomonas mediterranea]WCN16241.1 alanine--tRNA ligase [Marinomonas mediterranea MMB-1]